MDIELYERILEKNTNILFVEISIHFFNNLFCKPYDIEINNYLLQIFWQFSRISFILIIILLFRLKKFKSKNNILAAGDLPHFQKSVA